jgi:hypothetical protein
MSHSSQKRWPDINDQVSGVSEKLLNTLNEANETFLQLLEVWEYSGGTDASFANLLFKDEISERDPPVHTAEELAKVIDAKEALVAARELYLAATNQTITVANRLQKLRRMI